MMFNVFFVCIFQLDGIYCTNGDHGKGNEHGDFCPHGDPSYNIEYIKYEWKFSIHSAYDKHVIQKLAHCNITIT